MSARRRWTPPPRYAFGLTDQAARELAATLGWDACDGCDHMRADHADRSGAPRVCKSCGCRGYAHAAHKSRPAPGPAPRSVPEPAEAPLPL